MQYSLDDEELLEEGLKELEHRTTSQLEQTEVKYGLQMKLDAVGYFRKRFPEYRKVASRARGKRMDEYSPLFTADDEPLVVEALQLLLVITSKLLDNTNSDIRLRYTAKLSRINNCARRLGLEL